MVGLNLGAKKALVAHVMARSVPQSGAAVGLPLVRQKQGITNSKSIILAHNHPSGDTTPSMEDIRVTKTLIDAGNLLNIKVLDHVIAGKNSFTSLKAEGYF